MPTTSYPNPVPVVHRQRSPRSQGFFKDDGCELAPACLACPLSRCQFDDWDWYRFWRRRARFLAIGEAIEREKLTTEDAAHRFRVGIRAIQRALRFCRKAAHLLTADDVDVFILLAEADAHARAGLREVA